MMMVLQCPLLNFAFRSLEAQEERHWLVPLVCSSTLGTLGEFQGIIMISQWENLVQSEDISSTMTKHSDLEFPITFGN